MSTSNPKESNDWLALAGTVCVVTGAGGGIGAQTARDLAVVGAAVAILDRDGDSARRVADEITQTGATALAVHADVADEASVRAAAQEVLSVLGPCRVLVNNAAIRHRERLIQIKPESWNRVLGVNLTGSLLCVQAFAAQMVEAGQGGSLIHVTSLLGHHPQMDAGAYSVSKAGTMMMSQVLALELAPHGIRSNTVSPGFTRTPATEAFYSDPPTFAARAARIPAGRPAWPGDLANVICFLASERSNYVNAQDVIVDGGVDSTLMGVVPRPAA